MQGTLTWGASQYSGAVDEALVTGYRVIMTTSCGAYVSYVGSQNKVGSDATCCKDDEYSLTIDIPTYDPSATHFVIQVVTSASGTSEAGVMVPIIDLGSTSTPAPAPPAAASCATNLARVGAVVFSAVAAFLA